jgi:serine/threonine-protein kinase
MQPQVGKYTLVRRLGAGGMGDVFLARLNGLGGFSREVALKVIRAELAAIPRFKELFLREGRVLGALSHRGVVQVYEVGEDEGRLYLAMEYLRGVTLRQLMGPGLPARISAAVVAEIARAVTAAHALRLPEAASGLVHGDLSPSNVMVCTDGAVKVLDFGLARPAGAEKSTSSVGGKLPYLAPELLSGMPNDAQTDVYALGAILYELFTGQVPFTGKNDLEIVRRALHGHPAPPRSLRPELDADLESVTLQALALDRTVRFSTAAALADALEQAVRGQVRPTELAGLSLKAWTQTSAASDLLNPPSAMVLKGTRRRTALQAVAITVALSIGLALGWWGRQTKPEESLAAPPALARPAPTAVTPPTVAPPPVPRPPPTPAPEATAAERKTVTRKPKPPARSVTTSPATHPDGPIDPFKDP